MEICAKELRPGQNCELEAGHAGHCWALNRDQAESRYCDVPVGGAMFCPLPREHGGPHQRPDDPQWQAERLAERLRYDWTLGSTPPIQTTPDPLQDAREQIADLVAMLPRLTANAERHFWEMAFCAAMPMHMDVRGLAQKSASTGDLADAALEEWRKRWVK